MKLHHTCLDQMRVRHSESDERISEAKESLHNETKGSAGDKHETSREMARQELEKVELNHAELVKAVHQLERLNPNQKHGKIQLGSLIKTEDAFYYISISLGEIKVQETSVFCISSNAPIARSLMSLREGDQIAFMGKELFIDEIA